MAVKIQGGSSTAGQANVTSDYALQVATSQTLTNVGGTIATALIDAGSVTGTRTVRPIDVTDDYRERVGVDQSLFRDVFNYTANPTGNYSMVTSTATIGLSGRRLVLNSGSSVTSAHATQVTSRSLFQQPQTFPMYAEVWCAIPNTPQSNTVLEWGFGIASGTSAPSDGVFFRYAAGGEIRGVLNVAGAEVQTDPFTDLTGIGYTPGTVHHWLIVSSTDEVEFWRDDVLLATVARPTAEPGQSASMSLPIYARFYNSSTAVSAQQLSIASWAVSTGDNATSRTVQSVAAVNMQHASNQPPGATAGQTANYANSAAPASLTLSNTTATNGVTVLGGQWQFAAVAGAETDYIVFAFLNPAGTATIAGRNLFVYGVTIDTYNMGAASATTPTLLQWAIGYGNTGVTLATAESATAGTMPSRRLLVGVQTIPVGTAVGGMASPSINFRMTSPVVVPPGTHLHLILKMPVGTATASQIIRGIASFDAHFEAT